MTAAITGFERAIDSASKEE